jgi:ankyrin repeat protein
VAALLLERGATADIGDQLTGKTALVKAAYAGHAEMVRLLAERASADLDGGDSQGYTALAFACAFSTLEHAACVDALLRARASPNVVDSYGVTPLMHAAARGHIDLVHTLLQVHAPWALAAQPGPRCTPAAGQGHRPPEHLVALCALRGNACTP